MVSHNDIRRVALDLPGAFEQESYGGRPSFRTKARIFTLIREEPEALVVWVGPVEEKDAMIVGEPGTFFTTDHYDGHPIVLVSLDRVGVDEATELITESWRLRAPKTLVKQWDAEHS